jgi:hypothetical protein
MGNGFMLIPISVKLILFLLPLYFNSSFLLTIISEFLLILSIGINKYLNDNATCENNKQENNFSFTKFICIMLRAIWYSGATYGVYTLFVNIFEILSFLPIPPFMFIKYLKYPIETLIKSILEYFLGRYVSMIQIFLLWTLSFSIVFPIGSAIDQNNLYSLCNPATVPLDVSLFSIVGAIIIFFSNMRSSSYESTADSSTKYLKKKIK